MKHVLVLGAGVYQLPLIRRVREAGLRPVVVSTPGDWPGIAEAAEFHAIDTRDTPALLTLAREKAVAAVLSTGTDVCLPAWAAVAAHCSLPGPSVDMAAVAADKHRMKAHCRAWGICTPDFLSVGQPDEVRRAVRKWGRVMLKAPRSSGSRGIVELSGQDSVDTAWAAVRQVAPTGPLVVEQCVRGLEFGAQVLVDGPGRHRVVAHRDTLDGEARQVPVGHGLPALLPRPAEAQLGPLVECLLSSLGPVRGWLNLDLIYDGSRLHLIEFALRPGATCLPELLAYACHFDSYGFMLAQALGGAHALPGLPERPCAAMLLRSRVAGRLRGLRLPGPGPWTPRVLDVSVDPRPAASVQRFTNGTHRLGHVLMAADTVEQAEADAAAFADAVEWDIEASGEDGPGADRVRAVRSSTA